MNSSALCQTLSSISNNLQNVSILSNLGVAFIQNQNRNFWWINLAEVGAHALVNFVEQKFCYNDLDYSQQTILKSVSKTEIAAAFLTPFCKSKYCYLLAAGALWFFNYNRAEEYTKMSWVELDRYRRAFESNLNAFEKNLDIEIEERVKLLKVTHDPKNVCEKLSNFEFKTDELKAIMELSLIKCFDVNQKLLNLAGQINQKHGIDLKFEDYTLDEKEKWLEDEAPKLLAKRNEDQNYKLHSLCFKAIQAATDLNRIVESTKKDFGASSKFQRLALFASNVVKLNNEGSSSSSGESSTIDPAFKMTALALIKECQEAILNQSNVFLEKANLCLNG